MLGTAVARVQCPDDRNGARVETICSVSAYRALSPMVGGKPDFNQLSIGFDISLSLRFLRGSWLGAATGIHGS